MRLAHPGLAVTVDVAPAAAAEPVAGFGMEASRRPRSGAAVTGPDAVPDIVAAAAAGTHVVGRVEVLAAAERGRTFTALGD